MYLSITLISFVLLALQLVLMRILNATHGHHMAYVVIAVALLGIGASGSLLAVWRRYIRRITAEQLFAPSMLLCALCTALLPFLIRPLLAGIEIDLLHAEPRQWLRLMGLGVVALLPFFFGAAALAIAFTVRAGAIGGLYAANLLGSAAGALVAIGALAIWMPERTLPALSLVALLAALPARPRRVSAWFVAVMLAIAALNPVTLPRSEYKPIRYALQLPSARHEGPFAHPLGRLEIVSAPALRYAPDLSLLYTGAVPAPAHLYVDGETAGVLLPADAAGALVLAHTPRALPFATDQLRRVLLLAPGGTPVINLASRHGATITAVEPHGLVAERMRLLVNAETVTIHTQDPRLFLSRLPAGLEFDLIVFPERGQFGGATGLQTLGEDYLFTVEALRTAFGALGPAGFLSVNVWLDEPLRYAPRAVSLVAEALRATGVADPSGQLVIVRGWGSLSLLARRVPFHPQHLAAARRFADTHGFDLIWPPGGGTAPRRHSGGSSDLAGMMAGLLGPHADAFHDRTRFDLRAPQDNRPFFNQFLRPGDEAEDLQQLSISERGLVFLRTLLVLLAAAVALLAVGPLLILKTGRSLSPFTLLYFSGLGAGFMIYEVALIQRFMLLLGDPVTAAGAVIAALLCGMSAGSLLSHRLPVRPVLLVLLALGAALAQGVVLFMLARFTGTLLTLSAFERYLVTLLAAGVPAVIMGIPFPLGIRRLALKAPDHIPWACGIDGAVSVISAPVSLWVAVLFGFNALGAASGAFYLLAALAALPLTIARSR